MSLKDVIVQRNIIPYDDLNTVGSDAGNLKLGDDVNVGIAGLVVQHKGTARLVTSGYRGNYAPSGLDEPVPISVGITRSWEAITILPSAPYVHNSLSPEIQHKGQVQTLIIVEIAAVPGDGSILSILVEHKNPVTGTFFGGTNVSGQTYTTTGPNLTETKWAWILNSTSYPAGIYPSTRFRVSISAPSSPFTVGIYGIHVYA